MDWISVKERLPENNVQVLAFSHDLKLGKLKRPCCVLLSYSDTRGWFLNDEKYRDVTHWIPIPQLPS